MSHCRDGNSACKYRYCHQAQDHDELLAFLLGGLVKDKYRHETIKLQGQAPPKVDIKLGELEDRVRVCLLVNQWHLSKLM